ncbi:MAG: hypothetical protein WD077_04855 [Bacteroidia bacterium]
MISPAEKMVIINLLEDGKYRTLKPRVQGSLSPQQFPKVKVELDALFEGLLE